MALAATIRVSVSGQQTNPLDLGTATLPFDDSLTVALASGIGANQADRVFTDQRTLGPSATEDLDLAGVLVEAYGTTLTFAKLKAIIVKAAAGNTNDLNVTRPASNGVPLFLAAADGLTVRPGGVFAWVAPGTGVTVTAGTGDLLTFTNAAAGTSITYDVVLIGTSA